jgi:hypothetical protein
MANFNEEEKEFTLRNYQYWIRILNNYSMLIEVHERRDKILTVDIIKEE